MSFIQKNKAERNYLVNFFDGHYVGYCFMRADNTEHVKVLIAGYCADTGRGAFIWHKEHNTMFCSGEVWPGGKPRKGKPPVTPDDFYTERFARTGIKAATKLDIIGLD